MAENSAYFQLKALLNLGFISCIIAIIIYLTGVKIGDPITSICYYIGNASIPISMMIIGVSIAMFPTKEFVSDKSVYLFSAIKLLVIPIAFALILKNIHMNEMVKTVFIYELAMPVGSLILALIKNHGGNEAVVSRGIVITTILSLFTIPMVTFFI